MAWPKAMPIIEVTWVDSAGTAGWYSVEEYGRIADDSDPEDNYCRTAGYLFKETEKSIALILNQSEDGSLDMMMRIPKVAVISRQVLRGV